MSRLLTQQEVDALLAEFGPAPPGPESSNETPFDLRAPIVLAGERLALVQAACEKIAARVAESLTLQLVTDKPVRGEFTGLVQQPASTVLGTLAPGEPLAILLDEFGEAVGGLSIQAELTLVLVDRLQGGEGLAADGLRQLSPVELRLLDAAIGRLARFLSKHTPLGPIEAGGLEHDPVFGKLGTRGGMIATAMFRLHAPSGVAVCRLLMTPVLINRLVAQVDELEASQPPGELLEALSEVPVQVEPVVIGGNARLFDLLQLRPGQAIQLEVRESDLLGLRFNDALLARGRLQLKGGGREFVIEEVA